VEVKNDEAVGYVNCETGFRSQRSIQGVNRLIYISDTNREERHRQPNIESTINIKICQPIPIDLLYLEVKPALYYHVLSISSVLKSMRILPS